MSTYIRDIEFLQQIEKAQELARNWKPTSK
jgi:hypothetical protein